MKTRKNKSWSIKYKKSINCKHPKGFSQKQYCKKKKFNVTKKRIINAKAVLKMKNNVYGFVKFLKHKRGVKVIYNIKGLSDGLHGFHIHQNKIKHDDCLTTGSHFNPDNRKHSSRHSHSRHAGDFGNIKSYKKKAYGSFIDSKISLNSKSKYYIIGRSIVVHEKKDDLGLGKNKESKITGNAGKRLNCAIIKKYKY